MIHFQELAFAAGLVAHYRSHRRDYRTPRDMLIQLGLGNA